jgi:replication initiation and membrane attachment protein DnaB
MTVLEKAVSKMQKLPTEQQQQVLRFIEFLTFELGDRAVNQESENLIEKKEQVSPCDLLKKWEGAVEGGVDNFSL